ncbi:hypothetical protein Pan153_50160 [Gimesia panareensis]|uniref:Uncharacterized protein n=1 Tax=Gimesia panareensis TaxID=2527978 RepID=A0A518FVG0_9PLAN|nr:hypothetical protein [Gimesia panareensis]QDV20341.1 hypothetical protein Pan153_50160 [Gimesia panareensis]
MSKEIAEAVIGQMNNQIDLLFTLTTAFCGGIIALSVQILFRNNDKSKNPIRLADWKLLFLSFSSEGVSILCGYLASGCLTSVTPVIYSYPEIEKLKNWTDACFTGHGNLRLLMTFQFLFFLIGGALLFAMLFRNRDLIGDLK